jgi:hypothetical protein
VVSREDAVWSFCELESGMTVIRMAASGVFVPGIPQLARATNFCEEAAKRSRKG